MRSLHNTKRMLHNGLVDKILVIEVQENARIDDISPYVIGLRGKVLLKKGDVSHGASTVFQVIELNRNMPTVVELTEGIMTEEEAFMRERLGAMLR